MAQLKFVSGYNPDVYAYSPYTILHTYLLHVYTIY